MSKVVTVSGSHGTGKSTLLTELKSRGFRVDDFKASRAVLASLNTNLDTISKSIASIINFQNQVFEAKYNNDKELKSSSDDIILVERSFADIFAYTKHWIFSCPEGIDIGNSWWLHKFFTKCLDAQEELYGQSLILLPNQFDLENDGVRPTFKQDHIHEEISRFNQCLNIKCDIIRSVSVEDRANEVEQLIRE